MLEEILFHCRLPRSIYTYIFSESFALKITSLLTNFKWDLPPSLPRQKKTLPKRTRPRAPLI